MNKKPLSDEAMKKKIASNRKSDEKLMKQFPLKLSKKLLKEFEENIECDPRYKSPTQFLKEKIINYNKIVKYNKKFQKKD